MAEKRAFWFAYALRHPRITQQALQQRFPLCSCSFSTITEECGAHRVDPVQPQFSTQMPFPRHILAEKGFRNHDESRRSSNQGDMK